MGAAAMMAISSGMQIGSQIGGAFAQNAASRAADAYNSRQTAFNIEIAEMQGKDVRARGEREATAAKKQARNIISEQRVALAAQGIDIDSGSALEIQEDTAMLGEREAQTIRNNAWREAWGYKVEALNLGHRQQMENSANAYKRQSTLLTAGFNSAATGVSTYGKIKYGG